MKLKYLLSFFTICIIGLGTLLFVSHKTNTDTTETKQQMVSVPAAHEKVMNAKLEVPTESNSNWMNDEINAITSQATNLNKDVLKVALTAYQHAEEKGITKNPLLTVVDYSKPSTQRRLWVIDLQNKKVLFNTWVSHGKNSGELNSTSFSNKPESLKSSLGVFVTGEIYSGKHGNSLRVKGLESGFNDHAYDRSIVFHGADYVSQSIAKSGRLGRSWGCWAVSMDTIGSLVRTIKDKALVVAYYPDKNWLSKSAFLN